MNTLKDSGKTKGARLWFLIWSLGLAGQICWNIENQWFNTFVYAKIGKDPSIITGMLIASAAATTFSTFFFGTWSDRIGKRRHFISLGYILWGVFTIAFGLTQFISPGMYAFAGVMVVLADTIMSFSVPWAMILLSMPGSMTGWRIPTAARSVQHLPLSLCSAPSLAR